MAHKTNLDDMIRLDDGEDFMFLTKEDCLTIYNYLKADSINRNTPEGEKFYQVFKTISIFALED